MALGAEGLGRGTAGGARDDGEGVGSPPGGGALTDALGRLLRHLPGMWYQRPDDATWSMEFVSQGCRALTGFEPSDLARRAEPRYVDIVHPDDRDAAQLAVREALGRDRAFAVVYRIRRVDGRERRVLDQGCLTVDPGGRAVIEGVVTDVTDVADLTGPSDPGASPKHAEPRFQALVEQSLAGIYLIQDERFAYVNARFGEIFGYTTEEVAALPSVLDLVHPGDRDLVATNIRRRTSGAATEVRYEFRGLTRAGGTVEVEVHGRRLEWGGRPSVIGVVLDASERMRADRADRETTQLEAVRRLASGVAHDLNNFLSTIRTTSEVMALERPDDDRLAADLDEIVRAVDDGAKLSRQLSRFAQPPSTADTTESPSSLLTELLPSLRTLLGRRLAMDLDVQVDLPPLPVGPSDLEEVVVSLALNAHDAMPHGGTLSLKAFLRPAGPGLPAGDEGASVVLELGDTGSGMTPDERLRAFEPYFTTKGARGTGLGLAVVSRIVRDCGGTVDIDSEPGAGTTVRIVLPATPAGRETP